MRRYAVPSVILIAGVGLAFVTSARAPYGLDYAGSSLSVNRTGDAIQALSQGDLEKYFATQPAIGPVSVLIRAPFAAAAGINRDLAAVPARYDGNPPFALPPDVRESQLRLYRFGVFPCAAALAVLAAVAALVLAHLGRPRWLQALVAVLILGLPLWHGAISEGHPGEFLTTALALGSVLAAVMRRPMLAAVLLGLALGAKQWAVLALPAVMLAVQPGLAKQVLAVAVAIYVALLLPMALGNIDRFAATLTAPATFARGQVDTHSIWFQVAARDDRSVFDGVEKVTIPRRRLPSALERASHPFIVVLAIGLSVLFWRRSPPPREPAAIFGLLALLFLLRCLLDPVTNDYYHLPFLASLALFEGFRARRPPVLTLIATAAFLPEFGVDVTAATSANVFYLAWTIPLAALLAVSLFRRQEASQPLRPKL